MPADSGGIGYEHPCKLCDCCEACVDDSTPTALTGPTELLMGSDVGPCKGPTAIFSI